MLGHKGLLIGGAVAVPVAFSLAVIFQNLWVGFFLAFTVSAAWLWMLDRRMVSRLKDAGNRRIIRVVLVLLVGLQLGLSVIQYQRSVQQEETLTNIRTTIIHSVSRMEMEKSLQLALRHYYSLPAEEQSSLADAFRELFEDRLNNDGTWTPEYPNDDGDMQFIYSIASPDSVVLAVTTTFTRGEDPDFMNRNNQTGLYQARAVLTERGVLYEREN